MNLHCNSKGFTLVEILTTLAILGFIATIGTTLLLRTLPNMRLKSATRDVFSAMMLAKSEAIKRNTFVSVVFDATVTPNTFTVFLDDGSGAGAGGDAGNGVKDGTEIDLLAPTSLPTNIVFGPVDLNSDGDFADDGETGAADGITFPSYTAATHTLVFSPKGIPGDDSNTLMSGTVGLRALDSAGNVVRSRSVTTSTAGRVKLY